MNVDSSARSPRWIPLAAAAIGALVLAVGVVGSALIGLSPTIGAGLGLVVVVLAGALFALWSRRRSSAPAGAVGALASVVGPFLLSSVATLVVIQAVPYGRDHSNPPGTGEPAWSSPRTRELMVQACFGCHSNEVDWPWYASVAPISWAVASHVEEGREEVNFSNFATEPGEAHESVEVIEEGEMPPAYYTRFGRHPEAKLSPAELEELIAGLQATPGMTRATKKQGS